MSHVSLKANETKILVDAAANGGRISFPTRLKVVTRQRMAGLFTERALAEAAGDALHLTRAGYRAVGLRPPRSTASVSGSGEPRVSTRDLVRDLLVRAEGASVAELMDATGWLPHTTRAALSRLRSDGQALAKAKRDDGITCYRLLPVAAATLPRLAPEQRAAADAEIAA